MWMGALFVLNISILFLASFYLSPEKDNNLDAEEYLVMHYVFKEDFIDLNRGIILDRSGSKNHGFIHGGIKMNENGGLIFNGEDNYIIVPDSDSLSPSTNGHFSIAIWMTLSSDFSTIDNKNYRTILGKGYPGNYEYVLRYYNSTNSEDKPYRISFYLFNLSGGLGAGSYVQETSQSDEQLLIIGVFNGTHVQMWKNGDFKDSDSIDDYGIISSNGEAPLQIGTLDNLNYFKGTISEIRIYSKALDFHEIKRFPKT
ncbi:LamG domain-containing protein [Candidatus Pacearchaeota archaeon]|nr:LamG domain-containing protein [Candidatus Pacearchaeota archaeon]